MGNQCSLEFTDFRVEAHVVVEQTFPTQIGETFEKLTRVEIRRIEFWGKDEKYLKDLRVIMFNHVLQNWNTCFLLKIHPRAFSYIKIQPRAFSL